MTSPPTMTDRRRGALALAATVAWFASQGSAAAAPPPAPTPPIDTAPAAPPQPTDAPPAGGGAAPAAAPQPPVPPSPDAAGAPVAGAPEVIEIVERAPAGAMATVTRDALERTETDDLHKVLAATAGVYVRDEDGYGLRPNIGMRGASAERSAKITLMEDGVLIAPAPYSAPAAYYFPLVTRLARIEVTKGPSAIRFGPNTTGGAINLLGEPMPGARAGYLDAAIGSDRYGKLHARAAERRAHWAVMAEYVRLRTDGFKQLDGGGPTGFDKSDAQLTAQVSSSASAAIYQRLELRLGYGAETSHETYTGLTDRDFAAAPQRRYAGSQLDEMAWDHWRLRASHRLELGAHTRLDTVAYRHRFHRTWGKVDGFVGQRDFHALLAEPASGANAVYYAILAGRADSSGPEDTLILGTNDRSFTSQGVQTTLALERTTGELAHHVDAGLRVHFDRADRRRFEDGYDMVGGGLVRAARARERVLDSRADTTAVAGFAQDTVRWRRIELSAGLRVERIAYRFDDHLAVASHDGGYTVVIPGGGLQYHASDALTVLAGVYRGFVPVAPSAGADVKPESSVNYEVGARWRDQRVAIDLIGFFSDYANLKGACSLANGCTEAQDGREFNGGAVHVLGLEAQVTAEVPLRGAWSLPLTAAYTLTRSRFQTSFASELAGWGAVVAGDELPYLPAHQVALSAALHAPRWELAAQAGWRAASRDVAGQGELMDQVRADALLTIDLTAHARLHDRAELYATCSNLLDEQVIVSRRPYGARPNPPRMFALGYKARF
jgi:Fe(3+) dicitrate transport protein